MEKEELIKKYKKYFSYNDEFRVVFEMGGGLNDELRLRQVHNRFKEISEYIFKNDEIWIILILWDIDRDTKGQLKRVGFKEENATKIFKGENEDNLFEREITENDEIYYVNYNKYSFNNIYSLVRAIGGYELGLDCGVNITAYFISFKDNPVLMNLYDDRGMELLSNDLETINKVSENFSDYVLN